MNSLFRAVLLDNITVLKLTNNDELVSIFEKVQAQLLSSIRQEFSSIKLINYIDFNLLSEALDTWSKIIEL
jgi:hypothetical protein